MKFKRNLSFLIVLILLFNFALVGCNGKNEENKPTTNKENEKVEKSNHSEGSEQVLNMSLGTEPDSLDVAKTSDSYSAFVLEQAMETLTKIETDESGNTIIKEAAAESWKTSEDELEWIFTLRDAEWSDGEPLKAQDYEYSVKRILNPETASPISTLLKHIKNAEAVIEGEMDVEEVGIEAISDKELKITLEYPVPYFLYLTSGRSMVPQRKDIVEEYGESYGTEADKLVFCGPFKVDEWVHNSEIVLSKNENYWDAESVNLDKVVMKIITEESALMGEFQNASIDFTEVSSAEWIEKLDSEDKYEKSTKFIPRTSYLFMNHEIELFSNDKVRKAFSIALDREEIQEGINQNMSKAAYGWIAPPVYSDDVNFREAAGDPVKELIEENPDPKALLVEGLKELGMDEDPSKITVTIMQPDNAGKEFGEYLQQTFNSVLGVNIELDTTEWPVFQERNRQLDYEMGYKSWGGGVNDPTGFLDLWITGTKIVPIGWSNPEYDELVKEAARSLDPELRLENFKKAEQILLKEDCAIIPFAYATQNSYKQPYVKNLMEPDFGSAVIKYVTIDK